MYYYYYRYQYKAVLTQRLHKIQKDKNIRDHSAWTIGNGDLIQEACIQHRNRHKNNARVVRNLEERNVGTKGKSPKQGLTSANDLTIELPEERESPYHIQ